MSAFLKALTYLIIFVFPTLANQVKNAGSTIMAILVLFGIYAWFSRKKKPGFDRSERQVLWSFAVYFLVCFIFYVGHSLFKENFSLIGEISHWQLRHEFRLLAFIPIYYLLYRIGLKRWMLWHGTSLAAIVSGVYGIIYIYALSEGRRATGAYHPIAFGDISLVLGFISLSGIRYFYQKHKLLIIIPLLAVLCGIIACFLSGTRIAFLTIPFLAFIFLFQLGSFKRPWLYRSLTIFSIIIVSVTCFYLPKSPIDYRIKAGIRDAESFFHGKGSGNYAVHLSMWVEGWKIFAEHPFLGVGRTGYKTIIRQDRPSDQIPSNIEKFYSPHNMYLLNMTSFGICGLLILLAIFILPLRLFIRIIKEQKTADIAYSGVMLIIAFMLFGFTESIFNRNININIYIIMLAIITTLAKQFEISDS